MCIELIRRIKGKENNDWKKPQIETGAQILGISWIQASDCVRETIGTTGQGLVFWNSSEEKNLEKLVNFL